MFDHITTLSGTCDAAPLHVCHGLAAGHATHRGRVREVNEDDHALALDLGFFVVADGVGGSPEGAVAARLATATMMRCLRHAMSAEVISDSGDDDSLEESVTHSARLIAAAHQAHQMIYNYSLRKRCIGAATTMVSLWIVGDRALIANTGDSRAYRLDNNELKLLTRDHSALQEYLDVLGDIPERARRRLENIVTQVLGGTSVQPPEVRLIDHRIEKPELFLLCSDGLSKMVSEPEIAAVLLSARSPQEAADRLIWLANERGVYDNVTCIVVQVDRQRSRS